MSIEGAVSIDHLALSDEPILVKFYSKKGDPLVDSTGVECGYLVVSQDDPRCKSILDEMSAEITALSKTGKNLKTSARKEYESRFLVSAVIGVQGKVILSGELVVHTEESIKRVFKIAPIIEKDVRYTMGADELFTVGAQEPSRE